MAHRVRAFPAREVSNNAEHALQLRPVLENPGRIAIWDQDDERPHNEPDVELD